MYKRQERTPALTWAAQLERLGISHPLEQVAGGIVGQQGVEVFRLKPLAAQLVEGHSGELGESTAESCLGGLISSQIEFQGTRGAEEGRQGPVPPAALPPTAAAEHPPHPGPPRPRAPRRSAPAIDPAFIVL